jgi:hypothetical protein
MDPFASDAISAPAYEEWSRTSEQIRMPGAPVVQMKVIDFGSFNDSIPGEGRAITGMCLADECSPDDLKNYVTKYADLFYSVVPLSTNQEAAVKAWNDLADPNYWLQVAHANGIH